MSATSEELTFLHVPEEVQYALIVAVGLGVEDVLNSSDKEAVLLAGLLMSSTAAILGIVGLKRLSILRARTKQYNS